MNYYEVRIYKQDNQTVEQVLKFEEWDLPHIMQICRHQEAKKRRVEFELKKTDLVLTKQQPKRGKK